MEKQFKTIDRITKRGDLCILSELLQTRCDQVETEVNSNEDTALHLAVRFRHSELAKQLVDKLPALAGKRNKNDETPFHLAAGVGNVDMVRILIKALEFVPLERRQEWLRIPNKSGDNAALLAVRNRHEMAAKALLMADPGLSNKQYRSHSRESLLYLAVERDMVEFARWMLYDLDYGEVDDRGANDETALHAAARSWKAEEVRVVFKGRHEMAGQDDWEGNSPLHVAAWRGKSSMARALLSMYGDGAHVCRRNNQGNWPVHVAAMGGHVDVLRWLIQTFDVSASNVNDEGKNILHLAVEYQRREAVQCILKASGLEGLPYQRDWDGNTPLHLAVKRRDSEILRALVRDPRVDNRSRNRYGVTAFAVLLDEGEGEGEGEREGQDHGYRTAQWQEAFRILKRAIPLSYGVSEYELQKLLEDEMSGKSMPELGKEWDSVVTLATLVATVTFAAAFTVPGGYWSGDAGGGNLGGQPVLLWDLAFRFFLITDIATMCTSLSILFVYLFVAWKRPYYITPYWRAVWLLLFLCFLGITLTIAAGVYTTVAPRMLWFAIFICVLCCVPVLTLVWAMWEQTVGLLTDMWFMTYRRMLERKQRRTQESV